MGWGADKDEKGKKGGHTMTLYLSMRQSEFPDECSNILFILPYMKGGSAGPWATQKINSILYPANTEQVTWAGSYQNLMRCLQTQTAKPPPRGSSPPCVRATAQ